jgi:hypothetical protein
MLQLQSSYVVHSVYSMHRVVVIYSELLGVALNNLISCNRITCVHLMVTIIRCVNDDRYMMSHQINNRKHLCRIIHALSE